MSDEDGPAEIIITDVIIGCARDDNRIIPDNIRFTIAETDTDLGLKMVSQGQWNCDGNLNISLSTESASIIIIKSEDGMELGRVTLTKRDWMGACRTSGQDLKRKLENGISRLKLTISIRFAISNSSIGTQDDQATDRDAPLAAGTSTAGFARSLGNKFKNFNLKDRIVTTYNNERSMFLNADAVEHFQRFETTNALEDLDKAIAKWQSAAKIATPEHLPMFQGLLGQSFRHRFEITDDVADLAVSIPHALQAVKLTPKGDSDITIRLFSLGSSLYNRFRKCGDLGDLMDTIHYEEKAVALISDDHSGLPDMLDRLGVLYCCLFEETEDLASLGKAIMYGEQSVKLTPDGHPNMPGRLAKLGNTLENSGNLSDISRAVEVRQQSILLTPKGDPDLPGRLTNLGVVFNSRFTKAGNVADLKQAIDCLHQAIELTSDDSTKLAIMRTNLGGLLYNSFVRLGSLADLTEAIYNQEEGIRLTLEGNPKMAIRLAKLAISYFQHFKQTGDPVNLDKAIDSGKLSVSLTPEGHYDLSARLTNLATAYNSRFAYSQKLMDMEAALTDVQSTEYIFEDDELPLKLNNFANSFYSHFQDRGDLTDLDEAIKYHQQALKLIPKTHPDLSIRFAMLAVAFQQHFIKCRDLKDLDKAIQNYQQSVDFTSPSDLKLSSRLYHLASSFDMRFQVTGDLADLMKVIDNTEKAIRSTPIDDTNLPNRLFKLGMSLCSCFDRTGDRTSLISSIQNLQQAVNLASDDYPNLALYLSELAAYLQRKFNSSKNPADLTEAINYTKQAIKLADYVKQKEQWLPLQFAQLAYLFYNQFHLSENIADLEETIQFQRQAVMIPETHPDLPYWLANLANYLGNYFEKSSNLDHLIEAIKIQQRAVELTPEGDGHLTEWLKVIGELFKTHFKTTGDQNSLMSAIKYFSLSATSATGPTIIRLAAAKSWAELSTLISNSISTAEILKPYEWIISLLSLLTGVNRTVQYRHNLLADYSELSLEAAAVAISVGEFCKAVEWLEQGRCVVWNQLNQLRTPLDILESLNPVQANQLAQLSNAIENAGTDTDLQKTKQKNLVEARIIWENEAQKRRDLAKQRNELLVSIREIPGLEAFLQPRKYVDLVRNLPSNGVVIIINVTTSQCDILALQANTTKPIHIQLHRFSYIQAISLVADLNSYLAAKNILIRAMVHSVSPLKVSNNLSVLLKKVWINIAKPIIDALGFSTKVNQDLPHIWWCPTGPLSFFPIHAAGIYVKGKAAAGQCLSDFVISSYIPNLTALLENLSHKSSDYKIGLVIASQPSTPGQSSLPSVQKEVELVKKQMINNGISVSIFNDKDGTVDQVAQNLESFTCVHLACHASQDVKKPLKSAFHLYNGPLELSTIMQKKLPHADLAFLSACQTSTGDEKLSEEAVHLAAGMLAAGYRSIVATMWSILDVHGPFVAERFYKCLLQCARNEDKDTERKLNGKYASYALHSAIQELKQQSEIYEMDDPLLAWVPYIHVGI